MVRTDTMETWDDAKLNQVVSDKRTEANKNLKTTIVCAEERRGWEDVEE